MKFYIKNTNTSEIIELEADSYGSLSRNFRQTPYELTSESEQKSFILEEEKKEKINQSIAYLNKTDWYIIRLADSGDVIPDKVKEKRALARNNIHVIERDCDTLEKTNNINTDF